MIDTFDSSAMLLPADALHRFLVHLDPMAADLMT